MEAILSSNKSVFESAKMRSPFGSLQSWRLRESINLPVYQIKANEVIYLIGPFSHPEGYAEGAGCVRIHNLQLQSNSVITNSSGPSIFVRYSRDSL